MSCGIFLTVHWLRLQASNAGDTGSIPGWGIKIPRSVGPKKNKRKKGLRSLLSERDLEHWHHFFLKCLVELTSETIWTCCFIFRLLINDSVSLCDIGLFRLSVSPCMNFDDLCLSRIWSISSELSNLWT